MIKEVSNDQSVFDNDRKSFVMTIALRKIVFTVAVTVCCVNVILSTLQKVSYNIVFLIWKLCL